MLVEDKFLLRFYAIFSVITSIALTFTNDEAPFKLGTVVTVCVLGWNILFICTVPPNSILRKMWEFCALTSAFQIFPDYYLCKLKTLQFPLQYNYENFTGRLGEVPFIFGVMWAIALLPIVYVANRFGNKLSQSTFIGMSLALVVFFICEVIGETLVIWHGTAQVNIKVWNTTTSIPIYVLIAESIMAGAIILLEKNTRYNHLWGGRLVGAITVSFIYTGALSLSWAFIEV